MNTPESTLVRTLGIPRRLIRSFASTCSPEFRVRTASGVEWTPDGVAALRAFAKVQGDEVTSATEKRPSEALSNAPAPSDPSPEVLTVARVWGPPRRFISCVRSGKDINVSANWISVRLVRPELFVPGMQLRAVAVPNEHHHRYLGHPEGSGEPGSIRYPRCRGRW